MITNTVYLAKKLEDLPRVVEQFLRDFPLDNHFALVGEMGAGKTTFVKALCEALGVGDAVSSPTFSIVNEYTTKAGKTLYHFDFYRLKEVEEALDFGLEDYLYGDGICLMEWADIVSELLPDDVLEINITERSNGERILIVKDYKRA